MALFLRRNWTCVCLLKAYFGMIYLEHWTLHLSPSHYFRNSVSIFLFYLFVFHVSRPSFSLKEGLWAMMMVCWCLHVTHTLAFPWKKKRSNLFIIFTYPFSDDIPELSVASYILQLIPGFVLEMQLQDKWPIWMGGKL